MFERIRRWHALGLWTADMVRAAAAKGVLTTAQAADILAADASDADASESEA